MGFFLIIINSHKIGVCKNFQLFLIIVSLFCYINSWGIFFKKLFDLKTLASPRGMLGHTFCLLQFVYVHVLDQYR